MLRVERLTTGYGPLTVLRDVAFVIPSGTIGLVVGPNGVGKTTLVHAIAGLLPVREGAVYHRGVALQEMPAHRVARAGAALVPQGRRVFGSLTVAEHLALARGRRTGGWTAQRVLDALPALRPLLRRYGRQLSGGEQQLLALGRALSTNPTLLLLDEPTEGLAPALVEAVTTLTTTLAADGVTVLVTASEADPSDARTVLRLHAGRAVTSPSTREHQ